MLTVEQVIEYMERTIAEDALSGNKLGLRNTQRAAGVLMAAAEAHGERELAKRLRILASQAANRAEDE